jgi:hypothetical protein
MKPMIANLLAGVRGARTGVVVCAMLGFFAYFHFRSESAPPSTPPVIELLAPEPVQGVDRSQGANLLWPSEDFAESNRWITQLLNSVPNAIPAPNPESRATRLNATSEQGSHRIMASVGNIKPDIYTFSVYVKPDQIIDLQFELGDRQQGNKYGLVRFLVGPFGAVQKQGHIQAAGLQRLPNGWYRCWAAMPFATNFIGVGIGLLDRDQLGNFASDGQSGLWLWGAQFAPGERPGGYVMTTDGPSAAER